jgi:hypothetical protein
VELKEFTMSDRLGPLVVKGEILADYRHGTENKPRWTDMALYKIVDSGASPRPSTVITELVKKGMSNAQRASLAGFMPRLVALVYDAQPSYQYAVEIIARSYVYHWVDGPCVKDRHLINTVSHVRESNHRWRYLSPCTRCKPVDLEEMALDTRIAEEASESHVVLCTSASDVVNRLYQRNGEISVMAAKMLRAAARHDPEIANVIHSTRKV